MSSIAPRTVRRASIGVAIAVAMCLLTACLSTNQVQVLNALNNDRKSHSLRSLPTHAQAQTKAQKWAEELARTGKLKHSNLRSGITDCWRSLGENVGMGPSVASIERAYMKSSGHRANILSNQWNGVGVGYAKKGNTVYTVQVFIKAC